MRRLRNFTVLPSMLLAAFTLPSCSKEEDQAQTVIVGTGPAGLSGATVFLDEDGDLELDDGELSTQTDETGAYELDPIEGDASGRHLVLMVDQDTVWADSGRAPNARFVFISDPRNSRALTLFTTLLAAQSTEDESGLKSLFGIGEKASLVSGYAADGEISEFQRHATPLYASIYQAYGGVHPEGATRERVEAAAQLFLSQAERVANHVASVLADEPPPVTNETPKATQVGEELFQNIPVDAGTMSYGVGMDEITRKIVSGSYCLDVPAAQAVPALAMSENKRSYLFRLVESERDLRELLNVGGRIDLGTTVVQGSLEGRFIDEIHSHQESVFALVKAEYVLSGYKLFGVGLASDYLKDDSTTASFTNNYEAFRAACGDRYLNQVTTGGAYYGLLKIETSSTDEKRDLSAKLQGKYGKGAVSVSVSGDLKSGLASVVENRSVNIIVGSRGVSPEFLGLDGNDDQLIDNLDDFFGAADQFIDAISNPENECHDDSIAFKKCAYTATFADYATATNGIPRAQQQIANLKFTTKLMGQYEDYRTLEGMISEIFVDPDSYDWTAHDEADVWETYLNVGDGQLIMEAAFGTCTTDFDDCSDFERNADAEAANELPSFTSILRRLPRAKLLRATTCSDVQRLLGTSDRPTATLYLGGDLTKPFKVSCEKMASSEPETYLLLSNTSGSTSSLSYNMSRAVNPDGSAVSTIVKKLLVNVNHDNLELVNDQADEQTTTSTAEDDYEDGFAEARLGNAVDCSATSHGEPLDARTNLDLTGTNFVLDEELTFVTATHPVTRYEWVATAMTWDAADAYATERGGHLVVIDDRAEYDALVAHMAAEGHQGSSWLGLKRTDKAQPAQYEQLQWVVTGDNLTSLEVNSYFYAGEPNNYQRAEDCVHVWGSYWPKWNDIACSSAFPFYIEYEDQEPTGEATFSDGRRSVDAWVSGTVEGDCVEVRPSNGVVRLTYSED